MTDRAVQLERHRWTLGERIGGGAFGSVFEASCPEVATPAALKLIPKWPGAERELLFVDLEGARNVVPVLDSGEDGDEYILVMERAEKLLRQHIRAQGKLSETEAVVVLTDIAASLEDLAARVVHRDLKPENVLLLKGHWSLADFGISRYAEATTAPDTRNFMKTREYASPEQWRDERATAATDVYALGVMAYEILADVRPFLGPDFREQHLHDVPPILEGVSGRLASLVAQCLNKHPAARPSAADVLRRLESVSGPPVRPGLARLQEAHEQAVVQRAEAQRQASEAETARERHARLFEDARRSLGLIAHELEGALVDAAPSVVRGAGGGALWMLQLGNAVLRLSEAHPQYPSPDGMPFEVHAYAALTLEAPGQHGYRGRSHSLWYCDAMEAELLGWYELAFMNSAFSGPPGPVIPFALRPDQGTPAVAPGVDIVQLAVNLRRLVPGELGDFVDQWGTWFANAYRGAWEMPHRMPEEQVLKNWRGATRS